MSKYTKQELKDMANKVLEAKKYEPNKYMVFLMQMTLKTNMSITVIETKIKRLAQ